MGPEAQKEEAMGPPLSGRGGLMPGDPTDQMAAIDGQNLALSIWHIPSGRCVRFKALIKELSDSFESDWSSEQVYGRMDPIETFQGTKRIISLSWDVVAFDLSEAKKNLKKMDNLANFLYPVYGAGDGGATSIKAAPLLRIKFSNLIRQPGLEGEGTGFKNGLVVRMNGFSYTPDFDSGVHLENEKNVKMYPQTISVQATFHVFHTHSLGWKAKGPRTKGFPHGIHEGDDPSGCKAAEVSKSKAKREPKVASIRAADEIKVVSSATPGDAAAPRGDVIVMEPLEVTGKAG